MPNEDTERDMDAVLDSLDSGRETKSLEELVAEGKISEKRLRSLLLLMKVGCGFSSSPEDAIYIQKKMAELDLELAKSTE